MLHLTSTPASLLPSLVGYCLCFYFCFGFRSFFRSVLVFDFVSVVSVAFCVANGFSLILVVALMFKNNTENLLAANIKMLALHKNMSTFPQHRRGT